MAVCVTGASGFIGSHVVKTLLEKGLTVRGTVRDPTATEKVNHLTNLPGAAERLTLFKSDLLDEGSFDDAFAGCVGVFHTASPFFWGSETTEQDFVPPALQGTLNVFRSIERTPSVKKVVLTSSVAAIAWNGGKLPEDHVYTEADWSDAEVLREKGYWYPLSKTLAERAAWDFIDKLKESRDIDLAVVNPTLVIGPLLQTSVNASSSIIKDIIDGKKTVIPNSCMGFVDVRDVAIAHWLAYEKGSGRYLCMTGSRHYEDWYQALRELVPSASALIPTEVAPGDRPSPMKFDSSKLRNLGWDPIDLSPSLAATVESLQNLS